MNDAEVVEAERVSDTVPAALRDCLKVMVSTISDLVERDDMVSYVQAMGYSMSFCAHLLTKTQVLKADRAVLYAKYPYDAAKDSELTLSTAALRARYLDAGADALQVVESLFERMTAMHELAGKSGDNTQVG